MQRRHFLAGLMGGAGATMLTGCQGTSADKSANPHACKGMNACKGQGGCKTADHDCKGKNACKGQGMVVTGTSLECTAQGGNPTP